MKWQVDEMESRWSDKLIKWQVDKIAIRWNGKLVKWQVDEMSKHPKSFQILIQAETSLFEKVNTRGAFTYLLTINFCMGALHKSNHDFLVGFC